jgi:hypothetical protein
MSDLPLGSYFEDGVRVGPQPSYSFGTIPNAGFPSVLPPSDPSLQASYATYGPGVLQPSLAMCYVNPLVTVHQDEIALAIDTTVNFPANMVLRGSTSAYPSYPTAGAQYFTTSTGAGAVQLDVPRVVQVNLSGFLAIGEPCYLTVFGTDFYGNSMQETIDLDAVTDLETALYKAFYTITGATITNETGGQTVSLSCGTYFGLPYKLFSCGDVMQFGWSTTYPNGPQNYFDGNFVAQADIFANTTPGFCPTITNTLPFGGPQCPDVRGIFGVNNDLYAILLANSGATTLMFTYYVRGADNNLNQQYFMKQENTALPSNAAYPVIPNNTYNGAISPFPTMPLNSNDLYGFPQYYTGVAV